MEGDPFLQTEICVMDSVQLDQHILGDYVSTMVGTDVFWMLSFASRWEVRARVVDTI